MNRNIIPREEIMKILDDGKWHGLNEFIPLSRQYVTPEYASRKFMSGLRKGRPHNLEMEQAIARGMEYCVEDRLRRLVRYGLLTIEGQGFTKRYKKT